MAHVTLCVLYPGVMQWVVSGQMGSRDDPEITLKRALRNRRNDLAALQ